MNGVENKVWYLREGLFAKYVISLFGLVVFVLAVNGATETWINYRATKTTLIDAMSEKAEATARRIEQSVSELERQISWVTRASAVDPRDAGRTLEQHYADYAQLLNQAPSVSQLSLLDGNGREQLRLSRATVTHRHRRQGRQLRAGQFPGRAPADVDFGGAFRLQCRRHRRRYRSSFPVGFSGRRPSGQGRVCLCGRSARPGAGEFGQGSGSGAGSVAPAAGRGADQTGRRRATTANAVPKLGWYVLFEQPTAQALAPIRDQLVRGALLISLGLAVAILAGTLLARRMLVPITALRTGARRLGGGDFSHRIEVNTKDELEELAGQFNSMAGQLQETYAGLESKVEERTRDLAQSINELKVLEEVGRAVASSLDLNAVLPTVAARAQEITRADAVLIFGYDATKHQFRLTEAIGIDKTAEGAHLAIDHETSMLGEAAASGEPVAIPDLAAASSDLLLRDVAIAAGFYSVLVVPLVDQQGILGALVVLRKNAGEFSQNLIGLMRTFAHQSVLAMRNARLFSEVDQKGRELAQAHSTVQQQAGKLQEQTDQLLNWNRSLEERVEKQLGEIERIRKLERFLAPQVAQLIASSDGHDSLLDSHRREVTVVFCDLRGFTAFTESTEPEEAMAVLREYHAALGELIFRYEGTLDRYAGDGVMILFNAPIEFADHTKRAVKMAVEMRDTIGLLTQKWRNRGHSLGFGVGIALGYATLGQIGFEQRLEYAAIGSVTNLASRLCDEAKANQIVVSRRVFGMVERWVEGNSLEELNLKGFNHPVLAVEILRWREEGEEVAEAAAEAPRRRQQ